MANAVQECRVPSGASSECQDLSHARGKFEKENARPQSRGVLSVTVPILRKTIWHNDLSNDSRSEVVQDDRDPDLLESIVCGDLPEERKTETPIEKLCLFVHVAHERTSNSHGVVEDSRKPDRNSVRHTV